MRLSTAVDLVRGRFPWLPTLYRTLARFRTVALAGVFALLLAVTVLSSLPPASLFGYDWSEYLLTSRIYLTANHGFFSYPYPLLPLAYVPVTAGLGASVLAAEFAEGLSLALLVGILLASYWLFRSVYGSPSAAALGALALASFPLLFDEAGWGGQSQFVAILIGLVALRCTVTWLSEPAARLRPYLLVGGMLALGAAAEPYATAFFAVAVVGYWLLARRPSLGSRASLARVAALLGPAMVLAAAIAVAYPSVPESGLTDLMVFRVTQPGFVWALYEKLTDQNLGISVGYPLVGLAYLVLRPRLVRKLGTGAALLPALTLALLVQAFLLTSATYGFRALYFLAVPFGVIIAEVALYLSCALPLPRPARGGRPRPRWNRATLFATAAVVTLVVAGIQVGTSFTLLRTELGEYGYPEGELSELGWLQHETGSILYLSPSALFFPVAWFSTRVVYPGPVAQPATFTQSDQKSAVALANALAWGGTWFNGSSVWVTDSEPEWEQPAPGVLEEQNQYIIQTLELNDGLLPVTYSPLSAPSEVWNVTPIEAPSIVHWVTAAGFETNYSWPSLEIQKTVSVSPDGDLAIRLSYEFIQSFPRALGIRLIVPTRLNVADSLEVGTYGSFANLTEEYSDGYSLTPFSSVVQSSASSPEVVQFDPSDAWGLAEVDYDLLPPPNGTSNVTFALSIAFPGATLGSSVPVQEASVLAADDIRWVVVDKAMGNITLERFLNDPAFVLSDVTPHYFIFETKDLSG